MSSFRIKVRDLNIGQVYLLLDREDGSPVFKGTVSQSSGFITVSNIDHPVGIKVSGFIRSPDGKEGAFVTGKLR